MTLHPQAQAILDAVAADETSSARSPWEMGAIELRAHFKKTRGFLTPEAPEVAHVKNIFFPGASENVPARYYRPIGSEVDKALPLLIFYHGGGWVVGDLDTHDVICRMMSNRGQFAVVSVDYRLAPENRFPAAVEDAWAAFQWAVGGKGGLAIDSQKVAVGGDSAGANLSAVVAIMARNANMLLCFQALIYPATSFHLNTDSHEKFATGYLLTKETQAWYHEQYLRNDADKDNWQASPALTADLAGVAPAHVLTCGYDPLVDEGKEYVNMLKRAGVKVTHHCFRRQVHGFITMGKVIDEANDAVYEIADAVAKEFKNITN